jgi:uncharacterized membrane protein YeiH
LLFYPKIYLKRNFGKLIFMDAAGLATFGIAGTLVAVMMDIPLP